MPCTVLPRQIGDRRSRTASWLVLASVAAASYLPCAAMADPQIGQAAPAFSTTDTKGATQQLKQYRGKTVVLEWTNADCPYTRKHYSSGNMQSI